MRKFHRDIIKEAHRIGFNNLTIQFGRKHPKLIGLLNGQTLKMVIPNTPSDCRSFLNIRADLRRFAANQEAAA